MLHRFFKSHDIFSIDLKSLKSSLLPLADRAARQSGLRNDNIHCIKYQVKFVNSDS